MKKMMTVAAAALCAAVGFADGLTSDNVVGYTTVTAKKDAWLLTAVQFEGTDGNDAKLSSLVSGEYAGVDFDEDFLAVINPVKIQVATNTVTDGGVTDVMYDRFFLPSIEEMYGSPQAAGIEGDYFPYWKTKTGLSAPNNAANNGRIITAIDNQSAAQYCRLRSAYRGYSYYAWFVVTSGQLNYYGAYYAYRCAPACVIS